MGYGVWQTASRRKSRAWRRGFLILRPARGGKSRQRLAHLPKSMTSPTYSTDGGGLPRALPAPEEAQQRYCQVGGGGHLRRASLL
eukprot:scaffold16560_cov104-Phaeocystis_antarctica.AAC.2